MDYRRVPLEYLRQVFIPVLEIEIPSKAQMATYLKQCMEQREEAGKLRPGNRRGPAKKALTPKKMLQTLELELARGLRQGAPAMLDIASRIGFSFETPDHWERVMCALVEAVKAKGGVSK